MSRLRYIAVWILLATVVAGGLLGPSLHRVNHALEKIEASEGSCHSVAVHNTDVPLWTHPGATVIVPECDLCATRLLVVPSSVEPVVVPRSISATRGAAFAHLTSTPVVAEPFIRGPPARA